MMQKLALFRTLTLVAILAGGCVSMAGAALANGGGGVGGEFVAGDKLATGGSFSCSEPVGDSCPNDDAIQRRANEPPRIVAHNHRGAEPHQYRY